MNSLELRKSGISAETETPAGGVVVRKPGAEEPLGLIMETAFLPVIERAEAITAQQEIDWTRAGQILYAEAGVTTAHEGASHLSQIQTIKRASDAGANIIDVIAYPLITDVEFDKPQSGIERKPDAKNKLEAIVVIDVAVLPSRRRNLRSSFRVAPCPGTFSSRQAYRSDRAI